MNYIKNLVRLGIRLTATDFSRVVKRWRFMFTVIHVQDASLWRDVLCTSPKAETTRRTDRCACATWAVQAVPSTLMDTRRRNGPSNKMHFRPLTV